MLKVLKTLRTVQWLMLGSILLYAGVAECFAMRSGRIDQTLTYVLSSLAVGIVGIIFVVRRTLVLPAALSLAAHPDDNLSLDYWKTGYLATYALCDALALFGLVVRLRGSTLQQSLLFYCCGFALLMFFRPVAPSPEANI